MEQARYSIPIILRNFNGNTSLKTMTLYFEVEKYENLRSYSLLFPIIAKTPAAKNPITKKQVKSKELRLHPCGPSLQGFHSKGSSPMPAVSGGEWHAAWIATFGKILVLTLSCGVVNVASLFRVKGRLVLRGIWWYILALMTSGHVQLQPLVV